MLLTTLDETFQVTIFFEGFRLRMATTSQRFSRHVSKERHEKRDEGLVGLVDYECKPQNNKQLLKSSSLPSRTMEH